MTPIEALDQQISDSKPAIELGEALNRLSKNREFKQIVVDGYLKDEAIRLVHLKSDPAMQSPEKQAAIVRDIDAIGSFDQYLQNIFRMARRAAIDINDAEVAREELLQEGGAE